MPTQSKYTWDLSRLQFRNAQSGQFVPPDRVFRQVNRVIDVSERRMLKLADQVRAKEITIAQFRDSMRAEVKALHVATSIAGNGGLAQMTQARWGKVGAHLRREYSFLNQFGAEIGTRGLPRDSARIRARARSYTSNARLEYWETLNTRMEESGMIVEASRKTGPVETEHCAGCKSAAGTWTLLSKLPAIGSFECRWFCQCSIIYRLTRAPQLSAHQVQSFTARAETATRETPLLANEMTNREREVANRLSGRGSLRKEKVDGRFVYFANDVGVAVQNQLALVTPTAQMSAPELRVFQRISNATRPVRLQDLTPYEATIANRLTRRRELVRVKRGPIYVYSRFITL
ncbi:MAG: hypothetical protein V7638_3831 [Acidobacteriota bacterium]|jgi:hypothetical protein